SADSITSIQSPSLVRDRIFADDSYSVAREDELPEGEILGLEWSRVDLERRVAWLDHGATKSGDGRGIPLNTDAAAALASVSGKHARWCFTYAGERIRKSSSAWDTAKRRAGIDDFRFHDLRRTWASLHVQCGTSLQELMELGGWKSYEMVLRYAHLAPEKLRFVAERIERRPETAPARAFDGSPVGGDVVNSATFSLRSVH
ncbi:MAG: site-specific integrase, partial [Gammaproteobacteria bacterium]